MKPKITEWIYVNDLLPEELVQVEVSICNTQKKCKYYVRYGHYQEGWGWLNSETYSQFKDWEEIYAWREIIGSDPAPYLPK